MEMEMVHVEELGVVIDLMMEMVEVNGGDAWMGSCLEYQPRDAILNLHLLLSITVIRHCLCIFTCILLIASISTEPYRFSPRSPQTLQVGIRLGREDQRMNYPAHH